MSKHALYTLRSWRGRAENRPLEGGCAAGSALVEHALEIVAAAAGSTGVSWQGRQQRQPLQEIMRACLLQQIHPDPRHLPIFQPHLQQLPASMNVEGDA